MLVKGMLFLVLAYARTEKATGDSFVDYFDEETESNIYWWQGKDNMHCSNKQCTLMKPENLVFTKGPIISNFHSSSLRDRDHNKLDIWLRKIWKGPCKNGQCAQFTSGELFSKHSYSFGEFFFVVRPGRPFHGDIHTWSCFTLRGAKQSFSGDHDVHMGINMCISSHEPNQVSIMVRDGSSLYKKNIRFDFDVVQVGNVFRIRWKPDLITFHVKGQIFWTVSIEDTPIPDQPMNLKILLLPHDVSNTPKANSKTFSANMEVFMVMYRKLTVSPEHVELFTKTSSDKKLFMFLLFFVFMSIIFIIFVYHFCDLIKSASYPPRGYNLLMGDESIFI